MNVFNSLSSNYKNFKFISFSWMETLQKHLHTISNCIRMQVIKTGDCENLKEDNGAKSGNWEVCLSLLLTQVTSNIAVICRVIPEFMRSMIYHYIGIYYFKLSLLFVLSLLYCRFVDNAVSHPGMERLVSSFEAAEYVII